MYYLIHIMKLHAKPVFEYTSYIEYLTDALSTSGETRGLRSQLAKALGCQSSFISQVLMARVHLSFEYALSASRFLNHSAEEKRFFMLLVQKGKAGSQDLEQYYQTEINEMLASRDIIRNRMKVKETLSRENQSTYYSVWYYSAIHILSAFEKYQTPASIATYLRLSVDLVADAFQFLIRVGLVKETHGKFSIGDGRIHLDQSSPLLPRHHANWRMKAIQAVDERKPEDLHFSGIYGLSLADSKRLKKMLLQFLEEIEPITRASKEEFPYILLLDLFQL